MQIEVKNISYKYNKESDCILKDISFNIGDHDFVGIIGQTGSGKSTLISCLNGLNKITDGEILFNGENIADKNFDLKKLRQQVGIVFQYPEYQLFDETIIKDVMFGPLNKGLSYEDALEDAKWALDIVGISKDLYNDSPFDISGGQQRRVAIAGILSIKPSLLILDEPAAGLDPLGKQEIFNHIRNIYENSNISIILVSHSMDDISKYCSRILVLNEGKLLRDDIPVNVFSDEALLKSISLDVPNITYTINRLNERGFNIDKNINSITKLAQEISKQIKND